MPVTRGPLFPGLEFQQEVKQAAALPIDLAEIGLRLDEPDLVRIQCATSDVSE